MDQRLECTSGTPCNEAEPWDGNERRERTDMAREPKMLDTPFWRVMAFVFTGLVAIAVWVMKANIERIEKINDNQIEMKTMLKVLTDQSAKGEANLETVRRDVEALKLSDSTQQAQLEAITGRKLR